MGSQLTNLIKSYLGGVDFYSGVVKGVSIFRGSKREREGSLSAPGWIGHGQKVYTLNKRKFFVTVFFYHPSIRNSNINQNWKKKDTYLCLADAGN